MLRAHAHPHAHTHFRREAMRQARPPSRGYAASTPTFECLQAKGLSDACQLCCAVITGDLSLLRSLLDGKYATGGSVCLNISEHADGERRGPVSI